MRRLRELSEAECYARCYGGGDDGVRVLWEGPVERPTRRLSPEDVRLLYVKRERGAVPAAASVPAAAVAAAS